jgi:hypothetical protein
VAPSSILTGAERQTARGALPLALKPTLEVAWMLLCGGLASGVELGHGAVLWRLLVAWLITDIALGSVFAQLVLLKRATLDGRPWLAEVVAPTWRIPYALPGSPAYRLSQHLSHTMSRWREDVWPQAGRAGVTALLGMILALVVASYLGRGMVAVVGGGLFAAALLAVAAGRDIGALERWMIGLHLAIAWLAGHVALVAVPGASWGLALLVGLNGYAKARLAHEQSAGAVHLLDIIWWILVAVLLLARQPVLAAAVAVAALVERMSAREALAQRETWREPTLERLGWLLATLLVALAVIYWV